MTKGLGLFGAILIALVAAALMLKPILGQKKPPSLLGEWTAQQSTAPPSASYKYGMVSKATRLGFGTGGREIIVGWVSVPHHPRPLPMETIGKYRVQGAELVQTFDTGTNPFTSLGLDVTHTSSTTTLTSNYQVQGQQMILIQPQTGKSVSLTLTAIAIPPSRPSGGGSGPGH